MARALRIQFPGAFYHITCRGVERRSIYEDNQDRRRFLVLLARSLDTYQVVLHAYSMMNNHFHLLIQTSKGNCGEFMRHFNISYTGWFNWHHDRSGNLYQGRYKAFLIDADRYLLEVSRYLHLNIVRVERWAGRGWAERWTRAQTYPWSSLAGYLAKTATARFVAYDLVLEMAGGRAEYRDYLQDGLRRELISPFKHVNHRLILGDEGFITEVRRYLKKGSLRDQPGYREMVVMTLEPEQVMGIMEREFGLRRRVLGQRRGNGVLRGIAAELMHKYGDITQAQIGVLLGGIDYGAVYLLRRRLRERMAKDVAVREQFEELEKAVRNACRM
jgi:REP element-mobilizing transposase RayT